MAIEDSIVEIISKAKDPVMLSIIAGLFYLLITLQRCYNGLLKTSVKSVTLLKILVFGKEKGELTSLLNDEDD